MMLRLEAGRRAYELSDYEKAVNVLQDAAAKNPRNGEALLLLAKSHFELRQFDAAIANLAEGRRRGTRKFGVPRMAGKVVGRKSLQEFVVFRTVAWPGKHSKSLKPLFV